MNYCSECQYYESIWSNDEQDYIPVCQNTQSDYFDRNVQYAEACDLYLSLYNR
jgi:hypothetical protein